MPHSLYDMNTLNTQKIPLEQQSHGDRRDRIISLLSNLDNTQIDIRLRGT